MSQLNKLRVDILSLNEDDLMARIKQIREDRKITKSGIPRSVEKKTKAKKGITSLFDALSPEEKAAVLAQLEGEQDAS